MNKEKVLELYEKYPKILRELGGDKRYTCMSWEHGGISCGDGWYNLLKTLFSSLQHQTDKNYYPQVIADQIKEKFGGLRIYYHFEENPRHKELVEVVLKPEYAERSEKYLSGMISFAETMSYQICEICGDRGAVNGSGWARVLCSNCRGEE